MKNFTEGNKMFVSVMVIFAIYAIIFILFEDYDRLFHKPFEEPSDWHLLFFSIVVMIGLGVLLHRYSKKMDKRISREQAAKESNLRRELTQNISHELKTPVASILGFTETMMSNPDIDEDTRKMFLSRTYVQAQRLSTLLQDISTLNRMDYAPDLLSMALTNVSALVAEIVEETAPLLSSRKITLRNCLPEDIIVNGNWGMIYGIFRNLIDNAANYAGEGATIEMFAESKSGYWQFTFSDDGPGIGAEHLPRIFERFYRIDKGRSRKLGGTGLGLSIVKNAVMLHGGTITAQSDKGKGLSFIFTLKCDY